MSSNRKLCHPSGQSMPEPMKHWLSALALAAVMLLVASACAPAAPTPSPATPKAITTPSAKEALQSVSPTPSSAAKATSTAPPKRTTVKFGSAQTLSDAGVYVSLDRGYFNEQGIDIEMVSFRTVAEMIAPLGTGQVDVIGMPLSTAILAAADRGVELKLVADKGQSIPKWEFVWIVLRKDLADSGRIKSAADLKGMKVAIPSLGSLGDQTVQMMLEQAGFKAGEVGVEVLPFAEQEAAMANKAIAASYSSEPWIVRGVQEGLFVKWIPNSSYFGGNLSIGNIIYGSALLKDQDLGRRWMTAYLKGVRDYAKAFTTKEGRSDVVSSMVKYSTVKDVKLYDLMEMSYLNPNGLSDRKSMDAQFKWYVDKGLYSGKKTMSDIVDTSFVEYAEAKLGKQ